MTSQRSRSRLLAVLLTAATVLFAATRGAPPLRAQDSHAGLDTRVPPSPAQLENLAHLGAQRGWNQLAGPFRQAARLAYSRGDWDSARAWFWAFRWAALFSEPEGSWGERWAAELHRQKAWGGPSERLELSASVLGAGVSEPFQKRVLGDTAFSESFFSTLSPLDRLPRVLSILDGLYLRAPQQFNRYPSLALAIAVVYDVPPPPGWPHPQVAPAPGGRHWPDPAEAFDWWTRQDAEGRTFQPLSRLSPRELVFVVDATASFPELAWSQQMSDLPLGQFDRLYTMVRYRKDRLANRVSVWPDGDYTLPRILALGGLCVDQAYFAMQAGKARGVPTLLFGGEGIDANHAWFGYLGEGGVWNLDAGRYAEERLETGRAVDPQTWQPISDHELKFMVSHFRDKPSYSVSHLHEVFSTDFLRGRSYAQALRAAQLAIDYEPLNLPAWENLLAARAALHATALQRETDLRRAALAFEGYDDIRADFTQRVIASLRSRGETSAADYEESSLAARMRGTRDDISAREARDLLLRQLASGPVETEIATFEGLLRTYGTSPSPAFYHQVVVVFVEHLASTGRRAEALAEAERARSAMGMIPGSQIDTELTALEQRIRTP